MSIQEQMNREALLMIPISRSYIKSCSSDRARHHNSVALRLISQSTKTLDSMSTESLRDFDLSVCKHLIKLDDQQQRK